MVRIFAVAAVAFAASACHFGAKAEERDPGSSVSRNYQLGAFDKIDVAGPYQVKVATGGVPGASATGGDKLLDETEVLVENGTLKIRAKKQNGLRFSWGKRSKAQFTVTTAKLHAAAIAGSGGITVDKVAGDFKGDVAGSGKISAAGRAASTRIDIAGSGDVDASRLVANTATVSVAGSGKVRAQASESAKVNIAGAGDVAITGGAKCTVSKAGSGNVTCG